MGAYTHNFVENGSLQLWDAGPVPDAMDAQVTNTTITRLRRRDDELAASRHLWAEMAGRNDKYTYEGLDSLRATMVAAGVVDGFRLHPEGINAATWVNATPQHIKLYDPGMQAHLWSFTFAARCNTDGNLIRVRIVLRDFADGVSAHLQENGAWLAADTDPTDLGMSTTWRRYGVTFRVPIALGNVPHEHFVWQISNGTAAAQVIDLDDIQVNNLTVSMGVR